MEIAIPIVKPLKSNLSIGKFCNEGRKEDEFDPITCLSIQSHFDACVSDH